MTPRPASRIASAVFAFAVLAFAVPAFAQLAYTDGGEISSAGGKITVGQGGGISISTATGDAYTLTIPTVVRGGKTHWTAGDLDDRKVVVDAPGKTTTFNARIVDAALEQPITVHFGIALTAEGKARITLAYDSAQPIDKLLSLSGIFFYTQRAPMLGTQVSVNGVAVPIATAPPAAHAAMLTTAAHPTDIVFASDDPYRSVAAHVVQARDVNVRDENLVPWQSLGIRLTAQDNKVIIDVELPSKSKPKSAETYAGIDFYTAEHIHVPQYSLSRNVVQNPSFEQGFQYWNFGNLGKDHGNRFPDNYVIDTSRPNSGRKCVKILGEAGEGPALLSSFAIPIESGKEYSLSFYARADQPNVNMTTCLFPSSFTHGLAYKGFAISQEWKRYSYTFTAPAAAISVQFGVSNPAQDCAAYLDDVQLEKGPLTDFTRKPIEAAFVTDRRDNLFAPGATFHGRWEVNGAAGMGGELTTVLRTSDGNEIRREKAAFKVGTDGTVVVALPSLEKSPRGFYGVEANIKLADGSTWREYGRLAIAPPADPTVKHHTVFATGGVQERIASWDRVMSHTEYYGVGSAMNFDPVQHALFGLMAKHHITDVTSIFDSGDHFGPIKLKDGWSGNEADLPVIEQAAYDKAKAYPEVTYWKLVNEPGGKLTADADAMKLWIRALTAAVNGIRRANPAAKVISIDPANMQPNGGIAMIDNFLTCGGGAIVDLIAIHPYRSRPEQPDMDDDLATFIAMLKRHNYTGDIWFTEGGGHLAMHNPAFALNVHQALSAEDNGGSWRIGMFSYDIGDGERLAAAYATRMWLVCLKYGDRVKMGVDWYFGDGCIDYDCTLEVRGIALNALSAQLGNATFVQDVPLSQEARCYLFKDPQNRPIAVVWTHDLKHESGEPPSSTIHLGELASKLTIANMTGSAITPDKASAIQVTPFPTYLRGEPGTAAALAKAIGDGFESSSTGSVVGYAQVKDAGHAGIALRNTLAKPITGKLSAVSGGKTIATANVTVAPGKTAELVAPFATPATGIAGEDVTVAWTGTGGAKPMEFADRIESLPCPRVATALTLDGNLASWKAAGANVFSIPQHMMSYKPYPPNPKYPNPIPWGGPSDLSATMAMAYTPGTLYVGFDITDDVLAPAATVEGAWTGDSIQLYFDAWSTGHSRTKVGYDDDDQELVVWPGGDKVTVYRSVAPATQVAFTKRGVVSAIKSSLTKRPGGYVIQLAIPEAELAPLNLKPGGVFNFSLIINDSDGEFRKRGLTLTPEGTEPFMHTELYPAVVLGM